MPSAGRASRVFFIAGLLAALTAAALPKTTSVGGPATGPMFGFSPTDSAGEVALEQRFDGALDPSELRAWLKTLSAEPNHVGSPHDKANAELVRDLLRQWGWDARIEEFEVLYPTLKHHTLELVSPTHFTASLTEPPVAGDATSTRTDGLPPYNEYGADGDVTGELVYLNYGMPEDYLALARRGIDVKGRAPLPRWSRDGKQIVYAKGREIWLADSDGTNQKELISLSGDAGSLRFSPDGAHLRFTVKGALYEVQSDGKNLHELVPDWLTSEQKCCGVWTPDGRYYVFVSTNGNNSQLYALPEPRWPFHRRLLPDKLTSGPMMFRFGVPTSDGKMFLADGFMPRSELVRYDDHAKGFVPFLSGISVDFVDFSRDGKWVVYVTVPDGALWRSRTDGSERLHLTSSLNFALLPHWSPDGTQVVYTDTSGEYWRTMLISAQGGESTVMYPEKQSQVDANFSPDGKHIAFGRYPLTREKPDVFDIRIFDLDSKQVMVVPGSEGLYAPRWSPDGTYLAGLSIDNKKLVIYDFRTQRWSDWITGVGIISTPIWSRDSKSLYFDNLSGEHPGYRRVKLGETHSEFLVDLSNLKRSWWSGITPDNIPMFSRDISTDEIYALELELP